MQMVLREIANEAFMNDVHNTDKPDFNDYVQNNLQTFVTAYLYDNNFAKLGLLGQNMN